MPNQPALLEFLEPSPVYVGKLMEMRERIGRWLEYVPATFPHYTRHTLGHSDEIIRQLSALLFVDDDPGRPSVDLSQTEAYILACAALLHDIGMVASDSEKGALLSTEAWKVWIARPPASDRWKDIRSFRDAALLPGETQDTRQFLADVQLRFLLAEFIRTQHHLRAVELLRQHPNTLGSYTLGDADVQRAVEAVCLGHGLSIAALKDSIRYPHRRDIRRDRVNIRFLAILLRLGDLLDLVSDRACPLLLSAASPLPADSLAHWSQYQRVVHRVVATDRIELRAECHSHEEHRIIQDWFTWIADEVREARGLMARAPRHGDWMPPLAIAGGADATLLVVPAGSATYRPVEWRFELDRNLVLERLTTDLYAEPAGFLRELIQNSADATRCRMYLDLERIREDFPANPADAPPELLGSYPIRVKIRRVTRPHPLSGKNREGILVSVEDQGIGMDADILRDHFLQVGRSYYKTPEFRQKYAFHPSSRFGVGFLSVFGVSDHVVVETFNQVSGLADGPLRLTLTGPSNFLLLEKGSRATPGTQVDVHLREDIEPGRLIEAVRNAFVFLEFPIEIDELGVHKHAIYSETPNQYAAEVPCLGEEGGLFRVRAFPVNAAEYRGCFYVFAHINGDGVERWDRQTWAKGDYLEANPQGDIPLLPRSLRCFCSGSGVIGLFGRSKKLHLLVRDQPPRGGSDGTEAGSAVHD